MFRKKKTKIFCIGANKTGTTSLEKFFKDHDYNVAPQRPAELLLDDYMKRNWNPIIKYCKKYEVFQDIPFSNLYTFIILDQAFPNSKFILSVRDSSEQWCQSLTKFHSKKFGKNGAIPTPEDLQNAGYVYLGWMWKSHTEKFGDSLPLYQREVLMPYYENHNEWVRNYFKNKSQQLLEINVSAPNAIKKLSDFVSIQPKYDTFPHENKT